MNILTKLIFFGEIKKKKKKERKRILIIINFTFDTFQRKANCRLKAILLSNFHSLITQMVWKYIWKKQKFQFKGKAKIFAGFPGSLKNISNFTACYEKNSNFSDIFQKKKKKPPLKINSIIKEQERIHVP